jgi:hypothetical protein
MFTLLIASAVLWALAAVLIAGLCTAAARGDRAASAAEAV